MIASAKASKIGNQETSVFSGNLNSKKETSEKHVKQKATSFPGHGFDMSQISILSPSTSMVQPKLKINDPNDKYEQEADRVADQIMQMPGSSVQRKCSRCEEERIQQKPLADQISSITTQAQRKCAKCEEEEKIQTKANGQTPQMASTALSNRIQNSKGGGKAMDKGTQSFMSSRFGANFGNVRIHNDSSSAQMSQGINAKAFTIGNDIYFNKGQYNTDSREGKHLLAHELTHTLQQKNNIQRKFIQRNTNRYTYGEIRQWAIVSLKDHKAPVGLADAKASIGAVCSRGQRCASVSGENATAVGDQAAWSNIKAASGGTDQSNNGNFMCVGHENCWFVHRCRPVYQPQEPKPPMRDRTTNLQSVGTTTINGHTLYFYSDSRNGNCPP